MPEAARAAAQPLDLMALLSAKQGGFGAPGSMQSYKPSFRDQLADLMRGGGAAVGANPQSVDSLIGGMDFVPLLGEAVGGEEAGREIGKGNYLSGGAQLAASLIPGGGRAVKALRKGDEMADLLRMVPDDPAQVTAKGKNPEMFHGVGGGVKLQRPYSEMTSTTVPTGEMLPQRQIDPAELQGGVLVPLYGDKTIAGQTLTHINDEALPRPQALQGGADFMRENPGQIWASEPGAMTTMSDRIRSLADQGKPIYGVHVAMGPEGGDFARMMTRPLLDMAQQSKIKRADLRLFDKEMGDKVKGWPGLMKADDDWLAGAAGKDRAALAKVMQLGRHQQAGLPDVGSVRKAITDPSLRNAPMLTTGKTVGRFDPEGTLSPSNHDTYRTQIAGDYVGDFGALPLGAVFQDFMKGRPLGEQLPMTGYTVRTQFPSQEADQQWLDRLMTYIGGRGR